MFGSTTRGFRASFRGSQISPDCPSGYLVACIGFDMLWQVQSHAGPSEGPLIRHGTTGNEFLETRPPDDGCDRPGPFYLIFSLCSFVVRGWGQPPESLGTTAPFSVFTRCRPNRASRSAPRAPRPASPVALLGQHLKQGFTRAAASHENVQSLGRVTRAKTTGGKGGGEALG